MSQPWQTRMVCHPILRAGRSENLQLDTLGWALWPGGGAVRQPPGVSPPHHWLAPSLCPRNDFAQGRWCSLQAPQVESDVHPEAARLEQSVPWAWAPVPTLLLLLPSPFLGPSLCPSLCLCLCVSVCACMFVCVSLCVFMVEER